MRRLGLIAPLLSMALAPAGAAQVSDSEPNQRPLAYLMDHVDPWTNSAPAADLLRGAGFRVEPLPLDRRPRELTESDVIFIASFASEREDYAAYMETYGEDLYHYVDAGRTLVQMTQADQTEASPPFLPTTHGATRSDEDFGAAMIRSPEHPLLAGIEPGADGLLRLHGTRTIWESFVDQGGFEVMIAADKEAQRPALMEGAYGQGRIILSAMAFDKVITPADEQTPETQAALAAFQKAFFSNLARHVVNVRERRTKALEITAPPRKVVEHTPGSWTIAVLPDTQVYSLRFPGLFTAQTGWIRANQERRDIRMVLHLGDIVNNNTAREWGFARDAMSLLAETVPCAVVPGNHDYGPSGDATTRETLMNEFFDYRVYSGQPTFGGAMEPGKLDNTFHIFEAGGRKWIVFALEWGPRDSTIAWANDIKSAHPEHIGILITHAYMNNNDYRYDYTDTTRSQRYNPHDYRTPGGVNDGEELWQKLVRRHNFAFVINGHVLGDGTGYRADRTDTGTLCHQMLVNYQMREMGGQGYLRLLEFLPDGKTVQLTSYSPVLDSYLLEADQQFVVELEFAESAAGR
ncbi:MAG: metallophosphoesterase [Phycisphaerales bacterium JB039]